MVGIRVSLLRIPVDLLSIIIATVVGSYAVRAGLFDVVALFAFGLLGYVQEKSGISPVSLVLALVLGPLIE